MTQEQLLTLWTGANTPQSAAYCSAPENKAIGICIWLRSYTGGSRLPYTSWLQRCVCPERSWHTVPAGPGTALSTVSTAGVPGCRDHEGAGTALPASRGRQPGQASHQAVSRHWVIAGPAICCLRQNKPKLGMPGLTLVTKQAGGCCGWPPATMQEQAHGGARLHPFDPAGASLSGQHTDSLTPVILRKLGVVFHLAADALSPVHHVLDAGACT